QLERGERSSFAHPNLALVGHTRGIWYFIVEIQIKLSFLRDALDELGHVPCIELACVAGPCAWQVCRTVNRYTGRRDNFIRFCHLAIPAGFGGKIDDDRTWPHTRDRFFGDETRRRPTRN